MPCFHISVPQLQIVFEAMSGFCVWKNLQDFFHWFGMHNLENMDHLSFIVVTWDLCSCGLLVNTWSLFFFIRSLIDFAWSTNLSLTKRSYCSWPTVYAFSTIECTSEYIKSFVYSDSRSSLSSLKRFANFFKDLNKLLLSSLFTLPPFMTRLDMQPSSVVAHLGCHSFNRQPHHLLIHWHLPVRRLDQVP